jgi:hypothetical protein
MTAVAANVKNSLRILFSSAAPVGRVDPDGWLLVLPTV